MIVIELFAGSATFTETAKEMGFRTWCTDIQQNPSGSINHVANFLDLGPKDVPALWGEDVLLWASPPCQGFSIASCSKHWSKFDEVYIPKSEKAELGITIGHRLQYWARYFVRFHNATWFVENPRGMMRKMSWMPSNPKTVTYCQYGDVSMKPTDIWTNSKTWIPRPMCKRGSPCHEPAPRGSKTGTQGKKNNYERSILPIELCREILSSYDR
jgi:site-specific DNA-cytosine methylase